MSFKGIAWAGNVYEKFETMCLEVEEAMYQDTVKYMENQVQKVGVSVKKFCSEVMKDLNSLSCIDPTTVDSDDLSLISHGYTDVNRKLMPNPLKEDNEDQVISDVTAEKGSSLTGYDANPFSLQSAVILIESKSSEKFGAGKKLGVNRHPNGIKRISRINHPLKSSTDTYTSSNRRSRVANCNSSADKTDLTSSSDLNGRFESGESYKGDARIVYNPTATSVENLPSESVREGICDYMNVTSSSDVVIHEIGEAVEGNTLTHDDFIESPASEKVLPDESMRLMNEVSDCSSTASDDNLLDESIRLKEDPKPTLSCSDSPVESIGASMNEGTTMKDGSSSLSFTPCNAESSNDNCVTSEGILKMDDGFDIEFVGNDEITESRLEKFETSGRVSLEESCILVEGEELHCPLQGTKKHKSYKRRIREALLPKIKAKKDDQFVVSQRGGEEDKPVFSVRVHSIDSQEQKLDDRNSVESDWELL